MLHVGKITSLWTRTDQEVLGSVRVVWHSQLGQSGEGLRLSDMTCPSQESPAPKVLFPLCIFTSVYTYMYVHMCMCMCTPNVRYV